MRTVVILLLSLAFGSAAGWRPGHSMAGQTTSWNPGPPAALGQVPPLKTPILAPSGEVRGEARVYPDYIEVVDGMGATRGAVGVVHVQGKLRLFLIRSDQPRTLIGWAENHRLYNGKNELIGYYYWTPTFSYVYDPKMKKVGEARCLAYQGVCAAAIAGYLLGLL